MSIGQLRNQMVGEPSRVPGYAEGYGQAPGQARPSMPAQPNPIGRPTLVEEVLHITFPLVIKRLHNPLKHSYLLM